MSSTRSSFTSTPSAAASSPHFYVSPLSPHGPRQRIEFIGKSAKVKAFFQMCWHTGFGWYYVYLATRMLLYGIVLCETFFQFVWWQMKSDSILKGIPYRDGALADPANRRRNKKKTPTSLSGLVQENVSTSSTSSSRVGGGTRDGDSPSPSELSSDSLSEAEKALAKKRNARAFLDLHFPFPTADVISDIKNGEKHKFPVIVCVTGGGWTLGSHFWAGFIGRLFADNGYLVVAPDYRNFPQGTISDMIHDVEDSIAWTFENIERYGGDTSRITLMGQSAGSQLLLLAMIEQAQRMAAGLDAKFNPSKAQRVIALSGLYDLVSLESHLHSRGLYRDVQAMIFEGKSREARRSISPYHLLRDDVTPETFDRYFPAEFLVMHGTKDKSAPIQESEKLADLLKLKCAEADAMRGDSDLTSWRHVEMIPLHDSTHTTPYLEDPLMMRSEIVQMICDRDRMPGPRIFESRKPMAGKKRLYFASKYLLTF